MQRSCVKIVKKSIKEKVRIGRVVVEDNYAYFSSLYVYKGTECT